MAQLTQTPIDWTNIEKEFGHTTTEHLKRLPNGPAAAAILAAGGGSLALGVLTTLAEASQFAKTALNLYDPVGPLSGKTTGAVVVWLAAWLVLHILWRERDVAFGKVYLATLLLVAAGLLGTFPLFFELFGH